MRLFTRTVILCVPMFISSLAAAADRCFEVRAKLTTQFGACPDDFTSPIGLCSKGTLKIGPFHWANTRFRALSAAYSAGMPGVEAQTTLSYAGELEITSAHGTLLMSDVGLSDTANALFTEISRFKSGTGHYGNARATLTISGVAAPGGTGFSGEVTGKICHAETR